MVSAGYLPFSFRKERFVNSMIVIYLPAFPKERFVLLRNSEMSRKIRRVYIRNRSIHLTLTQKDIMLVA